MVVFIYCKNGTDLPFYLFSLQMMMTMSVFTSNAALIAMTYWNSWCGRNDDDDHSSVHPFSDLVKIIIIFFIILAIFIIMTIISHSSTQQSVIMILIIMIRVDCMPAWTYQTHQTQNHHQQQHHLSDYVKIIMIIIREKGGKLFLHGFLSKLEWLIWPLMTWFDK